MDPSSLPCLHRRHPSSRHGAARRSSRNPHGLAGVDAVLQGLVKCLEDPAADMASARHACAATLGE